MFLIFWIVCIYFYVRVIRFSLKEIPKIKEYRKTMGKKEAKKKIKSERTKRDKLDSVLAVVFLFLAMVSSPNSGNKTETAEKKEVKKVEAKKEEVKREEPKVETKTATTEVDKSITTKEQKRLVTFLENADNRYYDNFKEILTAFDTQDFDKTKRLLKRYEEKLSGIYDDVLNYECKPTGNPNFDKECGELSQAASEEYTLKNNVIIELEQFFKDPNQMTLENVRTQFKYVLEKSEELRDKYAIFKNKNF